MIDPRASWHVVFMRASLGLPCFALALALAPALALATTGADVTSGETETAGFDHSTAWFVNPLPNAFHADAPVSLDVEIDVYQGIDDSITDIELFVDGVSVGTQACAEGCTFPGVVLEQGVHELMLEAAPNGFSNDILVYVDAELPSDTDSGNGSESGGGGESGGSSDTGGSSDSGDDSTGGQLDGGGGADEADGGQIVSRGCNARGNATAPWLLAPLVVVGALLRRRRA